ncbi:MAG: hypothetical protein JSR90_16460 [Proteobacteria bacterium]|nr:hypothetical protein [Pseudomonadota bacterium]
MAKTKRDWKASIFVPGAPAAAKAPADPSVTTHSITTMLFGRVETVEPDAMKEQWQKTVSLLMGMTASLDEKAKGWRIEEVEVGLTLSAKGELLFIAEAGAEGSVKVKLARK